MKQRRAMSFEHLEDAVNECQRLLDHGYAQHGKWSLGQICWHLRLTQDASMDGYPRWMSFFAPIRPLIRRMLLPRLLVGDSPAGIRTAGKFVPPSSINDHEEVARFSESVMRYRQFQEPLHPHPGFGRLSHEEFERVHRAHAAHHLGFLEAATETQAHVDQ